MTIKQRQYFGDESLLFEEKSTDGNNNQLLILANFAELMSESEYNLPAVHQNHQVLDSSTEAQHLQEDVNGVMANNSDKKWGTTDDESHGELTRLNHIRRQARCLKSQSQGSKTRLTQIRRQARSGMHVPVLHDGAGCSLGMSLGGITRLSQIRRKARSKNNSSLHIQSDCKFHQVDADNVNKMVPEKGQLRLSQLRRKVRSGETTAGNTAEPK